VFSLQAEGGYIHSFENGAPGIDPVRLTDRFFLGNPQIRGFDIRGVGPRIQRLRYTYTLPTEDPNTPALESDGPATGIGLDETPRNVTNDAVGGRAYYVARAELEIPLGASVRELGLRPSIYVDAGAVFGVRTPNLIDINPNDPLTFNQCTLTAGGTTRLTRTGCDATTESLTRSAISPFTERFRGDSPSPRVSVGFGVNWNSPFGPFRIDIARALLHEPGDDTKLFTFNVGTAF